MSKLIQQRLEKVRDVLGKQGEDLSPSDWKELLEELAADIDGHLEAIEEEA